MKKMIEGTIYMTFFIGFIILLCRDVEKLRWLGGNKEEDSPIKDGSFWFFFWVSLIIIQTCVIQINFLINITINDPSMMILYSHHIFGIVMLFALVFVLLIKGFLNPSLNFIIALFPNIITTIIFWSLNILDESNYTSPIVGLIVGVIIENILIRFYKSGNRILWNLPPKVWKTINNKWFVLVFTILYSVEMYLQIYSESITTIFIYI